MKQGGSDYEDIGYASSSLSRGERTASQYRRSEGESEESDMEGIGDGSDYVSSDDDNNDEKRYGSEDGDGGSDVVSVSDGGKRNESSEDGGGDDYMNDGCGDDDDFEERIDVDGCY